MAKKREEGRKSRGHVSMRPAGCGPSTFLGFENEFPCPFVVDGQRDPCMLDLDICFVIEGAEFRLVDDHSISQRDRYVGAPWTLRWFKSKVHEACGKFL